eukprot:gene9670-13020_t
MANLSDKTIGFIGCGKIGSALCRGYAITSLNESPRRIFVTRRNEAKSSLLKRDFPDIVEVMDSIEELVSRSDIIFIGLLPNIAKDILPRVDFNKKIVISMMAAVDYDDLTQLLNFSKETAATNLVKTVPLPSSARRLGPIIMFPNNVDIADILRIVGTPIICETEEAMKPLISVTGHISSFYELMRITQDWTIKNGVDPVQSKQFVSSFYSSLAQGAELSSDSFADLCEEAATPGGLNEQSLGFLRNSDHYPIAENSLSEILNRLNKKSK